MGLEEDVETAMDILKARPAVLGEGSFCRAYSLSEDRVVKQYLLYDDFCQHPMSTALGNALWDYVLTKHLRTNGIDAPDIELIIFDESFTASIIGRVRGEDVSKAGWRASVLHSDALRKIESLGIDLYDTDPDNNCVYNRHEDRVYLFDFVRLEMPMREYELLEQRYVPRIVNAQGRDISSTMLELV